MDSLINLYSIFQTIVILQLYLYLIIRMQKQKIEQIDSTKNPIYFFHFPFRAVFPYKHKYQTFAKFRWYAKPLLQTLIKEFKAYDQIYYENAIYEGKITINGKNVSKDYIIKNGDKLIHETIRQQPPILDLDIEIIEDNQEYLVVNKPPSFTVHTGGGFHYNTLANILQIQKGYKNLYILHRLDRLTSGLIIFGKNRQKPQIFHKQNQNNEMKKMYFARVTGNFQWSQKALVAQIDCISHKDGIYKVTRQIKQEKGQILNDAKNGLQKQKQKQMQKDESQKKQQGKKQVNKKWNKQDKKNPDLKLSKTNFKKVFYDEKSDSSLIECYPISGRTHQIRVHLQFLGYPILNDVVYGGRFVGNSIIKLMGSKKEKNKNLQQGDERQGSENMEGLKKKIKVDKSQEKPNGLADTKEFTIDNKQNQNYNQESLSYQSLQRTRQLHTSHDHENYVSNPQESNAHFINKLSSEWDIKTKPWEICLHSYQYKLQGKVYRTQKPYWAAYNFQFDTQKN